MSDDTITLYCLIRGHVPATAHAFKVNIKKDQDVFDLKEAIKEKNPKTFSNVDAKDLKLWKVNIRDDYENEIQQLILRDNEALSSTRAIQEYWPTTPQKKNIHVIISPPAVSKDLDDLSELLERATIGSQDDDTASIASTKLSFAEGEHMRQICDAGIIQPGDELWVDKTYSKIPVKRGCKVRKIDGGKLYVTLIGKEEEMTSLKQIEELFLDAEKVAVEDRPKKSRASENIIVVRGGIRKGPVSTLRKFSESSKAENF